MLHHLSISRQIKEYAISIGFDACGICKAEAIDQENNKSLSDWIDKGYLADMDYLERNNEKRINPTLLVENAKSVISVALNYYPETKLPQTSPQIAYYAYGKDYHDVMKEKLQELFLFIQELSEGVEGRYFVDTAPVMERYWAARAGIGFIGKNSLLIIPKKGSYFFLGEIILNLELEYDNLLSISCGNCSKCLEACPMEAIRRPYVVDSNRCISYQTIENKGTISTSIIPFLSNNLYGCDICQQVCPWNRFASACKTEEFQPSEEFLKIDVNFLEKMTEEDYRRIFKGSAIKRAKFGGLKRNLLALKRD